MYEMKLKLSIREMTDIIRDLRNSRTQNPDDEKPIQEMKYSDRNFYLKISKFSHFPSSLCLTVSTCYYILVTALYALSGISYSYVKYCCISFPPISLLLRISFIMGGDSLFPKFGIRDPAKI